MVRWQVLLLACIVYPTYTAFCGDAITCDGGSVVMPVLNLPNSNAARTISMWVKPTLAPCSDCSVMSFGNGTDCAADFALSLYSAPASYYPVGSCGKGAGLQVN